MGFYLFLRRAVSFIVSLANMISLLFGGMGEYLESNRLYVDYPYGTAERQIVDISIPKNASGEVGLILFIHGGGWTMGNKKEYRDYLIEWSQKGYVTAAMNYRFVDEETDGFDIMDDISDALGVIRNVAEKRGISIKKCMLTGASAGAHLCMLYAYSRQDEAPIKPSCVVEYCGPSDFTKTDYMFNSAIIEVNSYCCGFAYNENNFEDGMSFYKAVSPITYIDSAVPTVIAHGVNDEIVPFTQAELLDNALTEKGITHDFIVYQSGHGVTVDKDAFERTNVIFGEYAEKYLK